MSQSTASIADHPRDNGQCHHLFVAQHVSSPIDNSDSVGTHAGGTWEQYLDPNAITSDPLPVPINLIAWTGDNVSGNTSFFPARSQHNGLLANANPIWPDLVNPAAFVRESYGAFSKHAQSGTSMGHHQYNSYQDEPRTLLQRLGPMIETFNSPISSSASDAYQPNLEAFYNLDFPMIDANFDQLPNTGSTPTYDGTTAANCPTAFGDGLDTDLHDNSLVCHSQDNKFIAALPDDSMASQTFTEKSANDSWQADQSLEGANAWSIYNTLPVNKMAEQLEHLSNGDMVSDSNVKEQVFHIEGREHLSAQSESFALSNGLVGSSSYALSQTPSPASSDSSSASAGRYSCHHPRCRGVSFGRESDRTRHARKHDSHRKFICPQAPCQKSFYRNDKLQAHLRQKHSNLVAQ